MATLSPVNLPAGRRLAPPSARAAALVPAALAAALILAVPGLAGGADSTTIALDAEHRQRQQRTI